MCIRDRNGCAQASNRLIYASSAATYGDGSQGFVDDNTSDALAKLVPLNAYAWSKHAFDRRAVRLANRSDGGGSWSRPASFGDIPVESQTPRQWFGLKFFNVYGPNEAHKGGQRSVAVQLFEQITANGEARLFKPGPGGPKTTGEMRRDFVWIGDCVDLLLWAYDNPRMNGVYNCGSGEARSFDELAGAVFKAMTREPAIEHVAMPENLARGYQYFTQADMKRLKKAGYAFKPTSLEDGVARYVDAHLSRGDPHL